MASKMLGMPPEEVDNDSWDALGEIANMIAGNFKGKLSGVGNHCMLSVPTIIVGSDYETRSMAAANMIEAIFDFEQTPALGHPRVARIKSREYPSRSGTPFNLPLVGRGSCSCFCFLRCHSAKRRTPAPLKLPTPSQGHFSHQSIFNPPTVL